MKKISGKLIGGLNRQITAEFESAYLYLAMASYLQSQSLNGMAHWFRVQADEEKRHALKINDFMVERNITPELGEIKAPSKQWQGVMSLFDEAYQHECRVSDMIYDLVAQAWKTKILLLCLFCSGLLTNRFRKNVSRWNCWKKSV